MTAHATNPATTTPTSSHPRATNFAYTGLASRRATEEPSNKAAIAVAFRLWNQLFSNV